MAINRLSMKTPKTSPRRPQSGFTLLEVIVALAITGFILGNLFALVAGSKQLSWRSEESLMRAMKTRAIVNFALLENELDDVEAILLDDSMEIQAQQLLEFPERKTQGTVHVLQQIEIVIPERDESISGSRWVELQLPQ